MADPAPQPARVEHDWLGYLLAFGAAITYGAAAPLLRTGLQRYGSILTGITISLITGLLALAPMAYYSWRTQEATWRIERRALFFVLASGLAALSGYSSNTFALSKLPVVVVSPISATYPLVTVILVRIFLYGSERITRRTTLGALLIVAGVVLVTLSRR